MNPLVKKEIRLLFPVWMVALALPLILVWLTPFLCAAWGMEGPNKNGMIIFVICLLFTLGFSMLGIASFGQEFNSGTFSVLLSQPLERRRLWWMKTTLLGIGFLLILLVWVASACLLNLWTAADIPLLSFFAYLLLFSMATYSGGLWSTLLLRQTTGAFWFTLLAPLALLLGIEALLGNGAVSDRSINKIIAAAFLLYSIAGFFWARKMFLGAQDTQWTGGEISISWPGKIFKSSAASISARPRHWLSALAWKEIHLQMANLLIAMIILALHLFSLLVRKIHPHFQNPNAQFLFESHWLLWLLMPLLIGAVAVAEERRMGTLEAQLCLSVSRRVQLFVKFSVALVLSLLFGGVMPLLLEGTKELDPFYAIFIAVTVIFLAAFYASSAVRTMLQAIGVAILLGLVLWLYAGLTADGIMIFADGTRYVTYSEIGLEMLKLYLGPPVLLLALGWLTLWNFEWVHENRRLWRRNFLTLAAAFASIFILINGIYFRAWELFVPSEARGLARLNSSTPVTLVQNFNSLYATPPDGRLWVETLAFQNISNRWREDTVVVPDRSRAQFLAGSNWVQVAADNFQALGIQSDGTLWSLQRSWNPSRRRWLQNGLFKVTRLGSDTDWSQVAGGSFGFFILKKDGSLWVWGNHEFNSGFRPNTIPQKLKSDLAAPPVRMGAGTNWAKLFSSHELSACARKNDGSYWKWGEETNHLLTLVPETNLNNQWANWTFEGDDSWYVGVKTNGELWYYFTVEFSFRGKHSQNQRRIQLGEGAKWKTATIYGDAILAMREDGTLWSWSPRWDLSNNQNPVKPFQLGHHSDWIRLTGTWPAGLALAPDGNLYAWDQPSRHLWLAPSRLPVHIGNIFQATESTP